jgi:hypothetical protein
MNDFIKLLFINIMEEKLKELKEENVRNKNNMIGKEILIIY